jgi:hypothetical protein
MEEKECGREREWYVVLKAFPNIYMDGIHFFAFVGAISHQSLHYYFSILPPLIC